MTPPLGAIDGSVAPLVGAWIETLYISTERLRLAEVAPLVGAWIETSQWSNSIIASECRTSRRCVD